MADQEHKVMDSKHTHKVPPPTATPSEVRAYLVHILTHAHDATPDYARETADRWKLGRGWDLHDLSPQRASKIFGDDVGPFLLRTIKRDIADEETAAERAAWKAWRATSYPRAHVRTGIVSSIAAPMIVYLFGRVVTTLFVVLIIPQIVLAAKLPRDGAQLVYFLSIFMAFGVFMAAVI